MKPKTQSIRVAAVTPSPRPSSASAASVAQQVLELEADGIRAVAHSIAGPGGAAFTRSIEIFEQVTGRIIVSGMGKSGHIARKIAATMASTGTPAQFVHPAEASHGDLGMITQADAVLALSQSGETSELSDLLSYARRFGIPVVGITGGSQSALANAADVTLLLPPMKEACPLGLAPTTSTTAMLALGDAVAVALFERKGFSADDFHQFHPRGSLGRRFLRVADIMHRGDTMPVVAISATMADAMVEMTAKRLGCVGVVDAQTCLVGIITDGDLRRHMAPDLLQRPVKDIMTGAPKTIRAAALAAEALKVMNDANRGGGITTLFVVENPDAAGPQQPVGILHIHDILRAGVA